MLGSDTVPEDTGEPERHTNLHHPEDDHVRVLRGEINLGLPELAQCLTEEEPHRDHHHHGLGEEAQPGLVELGLVETVELQDTCQTLETVVCKLGPSGRVAQIQYDYQYKNCCNDGRGS